MSVERFVCWTDTNSKRFFASINQVSISIPGRESSGGATDATIYFTGGTNTSDDSGTLYEYGFSDTTPASIFIVPTIFDALDWLKNGTTNKAVYGTE